MILRAVTVCVDYSYLLSRSLSRWKHGTDDLLIVTTEADKETQALCRSHGVNFYATDIFYRNGARFNKGAALSQVFATYPRFREDWVLVFDADVIPPKDWRVQLDAFHLFAGKLYGARRYALPEPSREYAIDPTKVMPQGWPLGFFLLFHGYDPHLPSPFFDLYWPHAGNYDTIFARHWVLEDQIVLPLQLAHLGEERQNWTGRGNCAELYKDFLNKRLGWEDWQSEKMLNPPTLEIEQ